MPAHHKECQVKRNCVLWKSEPFSIFSSGGVFEAVQPLGRPAQALAHNCFLPFQNAKKSTPGALIVEIEF